MARRGFSRGRTGIRPPQRQIANIAISGEVDGLLTAGAAFTKAVGSFGFAATEAETLVRTRGHFCSKLVSGAPAGNTIIQGAFGGIKVSSDAFAIGVTALPGPLTDSENDWFMYLPFCHLVQSGDEEATAINANVSLPFDSRGMRKAKIGDVLAFMVEFFSDTGGSVFDIAYQVRIQSKT